jgi:hypothetical protein
MTIAMSGATASDSGLASGLVNTALQVGGALGLAVLATLSSTRTKDLLASGSSSPAALAGGLHLALAIGTGLVIAALVIGAGVLTRAPGPAPAVGPATSEPDVQAVCPEAA